MKDITMYVAGMTTVIVVFPLAEQITNTIVTALEAVKASLMVHITRCNIDMEKMQNELEGNGSAIGFEVPTYTEYYDDDEEYEEDKDDNITTVESKDHTIMGFH